MAVQTDPAFIDEPSKPWAKFYLTKIRLFALLGIVATVLALFGDKHWAADLFAQFKFQWAFGLGVLTILFLLAKRWKFMLLCLIGFAVNAYPVVPYFISAASPAKNPTAGKVAKAELENQSSISSQSELTSVANPRKPFRLMSFNVLTSNRQWDEVIELIKAQSPDFLLLMEVDSTWKQVLTKDLSEAYPYARYQSRSDNFGIAFLAKHRWSQLEVFDSKALELPSVDVRFDELNGMVLAKPLRIIGTHPIPPMSESRWKARNEQLFNASSRFDRSSANIMVGDFNLSPWSPIFQKLLESGDLADSSVRFGPVPTWHVFPTWVGGLKIDHALVNDSIEAVNFTVGNAAGSDHRPVILDFEIKP